MFFTPNMISVAVRKRQGSCQYPAELLLPQIQLYDVFKRAFLSALRFSLDLA
jgi:hypothetical protein